MWYCSLVIIIIIICLIPTDSYLYLLRRRNIVFILIIMTSHSTTVSVLPSVATKTGNRLLAVTSSGGSGLPRSVLQRPNDGLLPPYSPVETVVSTASSGSSVAAPRSPCGGSDVAGGSISCHVRLLWTALSILLAVGCSYSFSQPAWFINGETRDGLGLFNYCVRDLSHVSSLVTRLTRDR